MKKQIMIFKKFETQRGELLHAANFKKKKAFRTPLFARIKYHFILFIIYSKRRILQHHPLQQRKCPPPHISSVALKRYKRIIVIKFIPPQPYVPHRTDMLEIKFSNIEPRLDFISCT